VSNLRYPIRQEIDRQAGLNAERYEQARKGLNPSDVLATIDDMVAQLVDAHDHPLHALVEDCLHDGASKRSGKRPSVSAAVGGLYEPLIYEAITRLVEEKLADFGAWEN
jgi:hypothetical protein